VAQFGALLEDHLQSSSLGVDEEIHVLAAGLADVKEVPLLLHALLAEFHQLVLLLLLFDHR